jgi:hypothetical protein
MTIIIGERNGAEKYEAVSLADFEERWILVSADGGSRVFLGRPEEDDPLASAIVTLSPYYFYGCQLMQHPQTGKPTIMHEVSPAYYQPGSGRIAIRWTTIELVRDRTPIEIKNFRDYIANAEKSKTSIRAGMSGLVAPDVGSMNAAAAAAMRKG